MAVAVQIAHGCERGDRRVRAGDGEAVAARQVGDVEAAVLFDTAPEQHVDVRTVAEERFGRAVAREIRGGGVERRAAKALDGQPGAQVLDWAEHELAVLDAVTEEDVVGTIAVHVARAGHADGRRSRASEDPTVIHGERSAEVGGERRHGAAHERDHGRRRQQEIFVAVVVHVSDGCGPLILVVVVCGTNDVRTWSLSVVVVTVAPSAT